MVSDRHDPKYKLAKARSELVRLQPFFGTLALRLELREAAAIPVMGTDGRFIFYNPDAVRQLSHPELIGVVAHEVLHCAFQHIFRRAHRDQQRWNMACDYVVNNILLKERFSLPTDRLFDPKYDSMSAEEVYEKLLSDSPSGSGSGDSGGWNFGASLDPNLPNPETGETQSVSEVQASSKEWEIATKQAAHIAKQNGTLPGHLETLVEELLQPQVSWRQELWRFFNQRKPDRISWNNPNRRLIHADLFLPRKRHIPTGDVVIAIDTSRSISEDELQHFASEIQEIHKALQPRKMYVADIDTQIQDEVKEYGPYDQPEFIYRGRGGTSFEPVFQWVQDNNFTPDALVYLTDGYAPWPSVEPNYPVLWCITNHERIPPWGEHIILEI